MNNYNIEELCNNFEESCGMMKEATLAGDYKTNNREGKRIKKILRIFEKDKIIAEKCIEILFKSSNPVTITEIATYCLANDYKVAFAENVLNVLADEKLNGIFGFNAKMTLKVWKEKGSIRI